MSVGDSAVLVPAVAAILVLALYPQLVLDRSEESVGKSIERSAQIAAARPPQLGALR
jgi:NADH:ubiquinone oxidoreductase subunit 4 (subunit M)